MIYKINPIKINKMWAGNNLKKIYNTTEKLGEIWLFSAIDDGDNQVEYDGKVLTLSQLKKINSDIFNCKDDLKMQLRIVDAGDKLSVQVHPRLENDPVNGKDEAWYFLNTAKESNIIYGMNCDSKEKLRRYIENGNVEDLMVKFPTKNDDFVQIKGGAIHAIGSGNFLVEISTPSNTTFRFYDYNRLDNGSPRELHVDEAFKELRLNDQYSNFNVNHKVSNTTIDKEYIVDSPYLFKVVTINDESIVDLFEQYNVVVLVSGSVTIENTELELYGSYLIHSNLEKINVKGSGKIIIASEKI